MVFGSLEGDIFGFVIVFFVILNVRNFIRNDVDGV